MSYLPVTESYVLELLSLMSENDQIVALAADSVFAIALTAIQSAYPERFQVSTDGRGGMVDNAIRLADTGYQPWMHMASAFNSSRGCERLKTDIFYTKRNVKLVGFYQQAHTGGKAVVDDIGTIRSMPCSTVVVPSDCVSTRALIHQAHRWQGPVYIRLEQALSLDVYGRVDIAVPNQTDEVVVMGRGSLLREGNDLALVSAGSSVSLCIEAANILNRLSVQVSVVDLHTLKPIDEALMRRLALKTGRVVVVESSPSIGGITSAVAEVLADFGMSDKLVRMPLSSLAGQSTEPFMLAEKLRSLVSVDETA